MKMQKKILTIATMFSLILCFQNCNPLDILYYSSESSASVSKKTIFGANFNKQPENINIELLNRSGIKWVRGSLNMLPYLNSIDKNGLAAARYRRDLEALKNAKAQGKNVIFTLRWHFVDANLRIPAIGSEQEKNYFKEVNLILSRFGENFDIIVVGNEPVLETKSEDMTSADSKNRFPMTAFYRRLASTVNRYYVTQGNRKNKKILVGAFNRLDQPKMSSIPAIQRLIAVARNSSFIDGIDIHIHVDEMKKMDAQLEYARSKIGIDKYLVVTEFTLVRAFAKHLSSPLCEGVDGTAFCKKHVTEICAKNNTRKNCKNINDLKVFNNRDLIVNSIQSRVLNKFSKALIDDYYFSRSFLPKSFMKTAETIFSKNGVDIATFGFNLTGVGNEKDYITNHDYIDKLPWLTGGLYSPILIQTTGDVRDMRNVPVNAYFNDHLSQLRKQ